MKTKLLIKDFVSCFRSSNRSSRIQSDSLPRSDEEDVDASSPVVKNRRGKKKQLAVSNSDMWKPSLSVISEDRAASVLVSVVSEPTKTTKAVRSKKSLPERIRSRGGSGGGGRRRHLDYDDRCSSLSTIPAISPMAFLF